ncbi:hypothetical protein BH05_14765 [Thermobifida fusca]|nr:hypothetical protein [Thermobifida sp.]PPS91111.1 hypothetical protein BH05_14765 [Thermobifida fusca]PZN61527.1 MAG: hypothetical protein DIU53_12895 [Thermobifida fusca]
MVNGDEPLRRILIGDIMSPLLWQVAVHPVFDGQPTMLIVTRADGGPVTQADADRAMLLLNQAEEPEIRPQGPFWWMSMLLMATTVAFLCLWAWTAEWRWGLIALPTAVGGLVYFSFSLPVPCPFHHVSKSKEPDG